MGKAPPDKKPAGEISLTDENLLARVREWIALNFILPAHLIRTETWLLELDPEAGTALRAAALLHDVDRAFPPGEDETPPSLENLYDDEYMAWHSARSARYASLLLVEMGAGQATARTAAELIELHETGGTRGADLLMEADSISFLENNVGFFVREVDVDIPALTRKVEYMYRRIRSEKARTLATPHYARVTAKLAAHAPGGEPQSKRLDPMGFTLR